MSSLDTIILIDDNPADNFYHRIIIEDAGVASTILEFESADEALQNLQASKGKFVSIIFLDLNMPLKDGFKFLEDYQAIEPPLDSDIIIVVLTNSMNEHDRDKIADIDVVLDAVESGDPQRVREKLHFMTLGCTSAEGLGGPPKCCENESDGTLVEVFPFLGSEGGYLHKENLDLWTGIDVTQLYAIYRNSENAYSDANFPAGEYAILFLSVGDFPGTILQIAGGQIARIDTIFDTSPAGLAKILNRDASELILPPK